MLKHLSTSTPLNDALKVDKVVVIKSKHILDLINNDKVVRRYKIALGRSPLGHKQQQGDNKTPEGTYILDRRNLKSAYYKSFHISYPNQQDRALAKKKGVSPGGDIFLHGLPRTWRLPQKFHYLYDWTLGCIAVTNAEMDEILSLVKDGTPIEIRP